MLVHCYSSVFFKNAEPHWPVAGAGPYFRFDASNKAQVRSGLRGVRVAVASQVHRSTTPSDTNTPACAVWCSVRLVLTRATGYGPLAGHWTPSPFSTLGARSWGVEYPSRGPRYPIQMPPPPDERDLGQSWGAGAGGD